MAIAVTSRTVKSLLSLVAAAFMAFAVQIPAGAAATPAEGGSAALDQAEDGDAGSAIGTGQPIGHVWDAELGDGDEYVKLCHLKNRKQTNENVLLCATDPDELDSDERDRWQRVCDFKRIRVEWKTVPEHLGHADVFVDKDMRTDQMPDEIECGRERAWWLTSLLLIPVFDD